MCKQQQLRWSRGKRAGLWYPSLRVQTRPKPSDFSGEKILSTPSFGGEVKPSVPCRKLTACKRTQKWRGSRHFWPNSRPFLARSSTFRYWGSLASFQTLGYIWWRELERSKLLVLQVGGLTCCWQRHSVKTSLLRILNIEFSRPKPTRIAVPIEEEDV